MFLLLSGASAATKLTVTGSTVNVRGGPDTSTNIISSVHKGEQFTAIDKRGDWYKIKVGGLEGWIAGWLVQAKTEADTPTGYAVVKSNSVNVRNGPGTSHKVLNRVNTGTKLPVLKVSGDWLKVQLPDGGTGWIAGWLVQVQQSAEQQAASQQTPAKGQSNNQTSGPSENQTGIAKVKQATVTGDIVNVRSGPGTSNDIVAKVNKGSKYTVDEVNGQWLKINLTDGKSGWIAGWLASVSEVPKSSPVIPTQDGNGDVSIKDADNGNGNSIDAGGTGTGNNSNVQLVINNSNVNINVRGGPGIQHNVVGQVSRGQRLGVLDRTGDWYKVSLEGGVVGWIAGWLVDIEQAEASPSPGDPPVETEDTDQSDANNPGAPVNLKRIEINQKNDHTLVSIKAAGELNYDMFLLANPQRLVIDLKNTNIGDLPDKSLVNTKAVNQMRIGLFAEDPPVVRVVFDLNQAVVSVDKLSEDRRQLDLDIYVPKVGEFLQGRVIAIDPGHGGSDPGAIGPTGLQEKDVTLDIALKLAQLLNENGARVVLTRSDDRSVDLYQRTAIAQREGADVFLSIHINANVSRDKNGTSTYYRRDTGDFPPGVDQADNRRLAGAVQSELLRALGRRSLGVLQSNFVVLRTSPVPAALAEVAFVSNPEEEQMLRQEIVRAKVAEALAIALNNYFAPNN
ncbi:SH3 domain-containing protein [Desulfallas thermosapovorans]|nr:SH3 domain-containing protein [Desulfallas thermosapovorans]